MAARPKIMQSLSFFFATIFVLVYCIRDLWSSTLGADPETAFSIGMYGKEPGERSCDGKQVYIYDLPAEFNKDLVTLFLERHPIFSFANDGIGNPYLSEVEGSMLQSLTSFYTTSEYAIEYLYHMRLQRSHCRVTDPSLADLFYIPFYPALEWKLKEGRTKDEVDRLGIQLAKYMRSQKWFHRRAGKDHFIVKGLSYWTWYRSDLLGEVWGTNLEQLPEISKMYKVEVERDEWGPTSYHSSSVPYPTAFHPRADADVLLWQERVRASQRSANWSFMDFRVLEKDEHEVHFHVRQQCDESTSCELRQRPAAGYSLEVTMEVNMRSVFSIQLKGAAHTTRAFFDALLCGAIPVVLWGHTVGHQHKWHLPDDPNKYAIYFPHDELRFQKLENILSKIPAEQVRQMQDNIVKLIPHLAYAHPQHQLTKFLDAFDVTLEGLRFDLHQIASGRHHTLSKPLQGIN